MVDLVLDKDSLSGFKGVSRNGRNWRALIKINGKQNYLGTFGTEINAAKAYNQAAIENFGEYACLNEVIS